MSKFESEQWWLAVFGRRLVWSRLRVRASGSAEVFDCDGNHLSYDSEDSAHAALLDGNFVAFDGLDFDDANDIGIDLDLVEPPHGSDDDALRALMNQPLPEPD